MKKLFIIFFLLPAAILAQGENKKNTKAGLAVQIGMGTSYGGSGGLVEYQILLKENLRLTPFTGIGFSLGGTDTSTAEFYWLNYATGLNLEYGKTHRIVIAPQIMGGYNIVSKPKDATIDKNMIIGPAFFAGYKGTASFGLIWQLMLGIVYIQNPLFTDSKYFFEPSFSLGIGYKF